MAGIPLEWEPCLPPGSVHVAVTGTAMHWVADSGGLASRGSVFPGHPDHMDEAERRAWREEAVRQWQRLLEVRAMELAPGGRFIAALPPALFARGYVRSVLAWGGPLLQRGFAREGEDCVPALLADFLAALEDRVADDPDRYRRD